jgi:hypothetical protein
MATRDPRFRAQFIGTRACRFFRDGHCANSQSCAFAHGEVREAPDLRKTSLCKAWLSRKTGGACPHSAKDCRFAHGFWELRRTYRTPKCHAHLKRLLCDFALRVALGSPSVRYGFGDAGAVARVLRQAEPHVYED